LVSFHHMQQSSPLNKKIVFTSQLFFHQCASVILLTLQLSLMNEHLSSSIISYLSSGSVMQLIRLVRDEHSEDGVKAPHARSRHAMELKPYVEEPLSIVAVSNLRCLDLRPRIRHDFFLLNREAVDEYWKTLEYCYAAAHQIAAKHAFPGSVVPEVCAWCFVCQVFLA